MRALTVPLRHLAAACALALAAGGAQAGAQQYEPMAASVRAALHAAVSDAAAPMLPIPDAGERAQWLAEMSRRLAKRIPDESYRTELLTTIHYEATRAGLDPQMVLGLIQVESNFRKYAISSAGARGYMQVMPFWIIYRMLSHNPSHHQKASLCLCQHFRAIMRKTGNRRTTPSAVVFSISVAVTSCTSVKPAFSNSLCRARRSKPK